MSVKGGKHAGGTLYIMTVRQRLHPKLDHTPIPAGHSFHSISVWNFEPALNPLSTSHAPMYGNVEAKSRRTAFPRVGCSDRQNTDRNSQGGIALGVACSRSAEMPDTEPPRTSYIGQVKRRSDSGLSSHFGNSLLAGRGGGHNA